MVTKMYYSREDRMKDINDEMCRVQYDSLEDDTKRIQEAAEGFFSYVDELDDRIALYLEAMAEEGQEAPAKMLFARRELIENWALAQATLSKIAWVLRIDGNEAYQRMINAIKTGDAADMRGL